jgi:hypothetical protein
VAALATGLSLPLGTWTLNLQKLAGVSTDPLTQTQANNAAAKNSNIFVNIAGVNVVIGGKVAGGEWFDVIVARDWLKAQIQATCFQLMVGPKKLPLDDHGIQKIATGIQQVGEQAIRMGILTPLSHDVDGNINGGYSITVPAFSSVSVNDRNERIVKNIQFTMYLSGAIQAVVINGVVTTA